MARISIDKVSKVFTTSRGRTVALQEASLAVDDNEVVCIVGPSGGGSSTSSV